MRNLSSRASVLAAAFVFGTSAFAIDVGGLAGEIDPCSDFFGYVNQRWVAATELPPDRSRVGSFDTLRLNNARLLETALADLAQHPPEGATPGVRGVVADFAAGMDTKAIEARGLASLAPLLERIDALKTAAELPALTAALMRVQVGAPFVAFVTPDAKDKRRYALMLRQSGLGLPDRDDYFHDDEHARRTQNAYRVYARRLLELSGAAPSDATIDTLYAFERQLAEASATRVQQRDPNASYNPFDAESLHAAAPGFDWAAWLAAFAGRPTLGVVVGEPGFLREAGRQAANAPLATWRTYLRVRLLDAFARRLPAAYGQAAFEYQDVAIRGLREPPPRSERVVSAIGSTALAEGLGEVYVARAFSPKAQARALQLVADIKAALAERIAGLDWMSAPTKQRALAKLDAIAPKIGAPTHWRTYDGLVTQRDDFAGNALRSAEWQTAERLADLDRPVDRARWNTSPYIVNAYAGALNDIVFPAGILQPPFFDADADDAVNYGGIGSVIGHEITHHFDDRGRQFDADGNLADWWTPGDVAAYKQRVDRVALLYDGYEPVPGVHINGRQTLGENVSDVSGVQIAFDALQAALKRNGGADKKIDDLTPAQRYFVSYATLWRGKQRPEATVNQLRTDSHSPSAYRVLGPLSNMPAFAAAFGCKRGATMAARDPIIVW